MANRWTLLPPAMIALPFLVTACLNEPTAAGTASRAPAASLLAADPVSLKLIPTAGNLVPPDFTKETGNGPYSQARWTSKLALEGKFSVLLTKSVDFASCYTATPQNGCAAFAAAIVSGSFADNPYKMVFTNRPAHRAAIRPNATPMPTSSIDSPITMPTRSFYHRSGHTNAV